MALDTIFRDGLLDGKAIVVSGGGTGIGRACALELAGLGGTVVLCSRNPEHLEPTRGEVVAAGGSDATRGADMEIGPVRIDEHTDEPTYGPTTNDMEGREQPKVSERSMSCPVCGHQMPDLKGGKATICVVCGFKDSCCF